MKKFTKITVCAVLMVIVCLTAVGCAFLGDGAENQSQQRPIGSAHSIVINSGSSERQKMDVVDAIEKVKRACVAIKMESADNSVSYGSGTIINLKRVDEDNEDIDGENVFFILTCHHVISDAGKITVYVPDEEGDNWDEHDYNYDYAFEGEIGAFSGNVTLVGGDVKSDVALLRLDLENTNVTSDKIVKADLVSPDADYKIRVGESVFAIGNPSGTLPGTVSVGTIAYLNRETSVSDIGEMTLIQINVDIYHGSSGGALFNLYGELIGLTNAGSDKYSGLNYAIPFIIDAENGDSDNGFLNISKKLLETYDGENYGYIKGRTKAFGFTAQEKNEQVTIVDTDLNGDAYKSGLRTNDVIKSIQLLTATIAQNGEISYTPGSFETVTTISKLSQVVKSMKVHDKINLVVTRLDSAGDIQITLTAKQFIFCDTGK